ncbi:MAG: hypothetical protein CL674_10040 [Bdellovibrionaceae bacterium]|nr:hypothetical protein [Pseudobdellovibrionaceae bacterium]|tara:strand:+ start:63893 stop:64564 length:672 start_codon:yes stop_codon:yes gene_type:complete
MKKQMLTICLGLSLALPSLAAIDESGDLFADLSSVDSASNEEIQAEMDLEELMRPSPKKAIKADKDRRKKHKRHKSKRHFSKHRKAAMHSLILCKKADLEGEQKLELASALKEHAEKLKPLKESLQSARKVFREAVAAPNANSSLIEEAALSMGHATGEIIAANKSFAGVAAGSLFAEDKAILGLACVNSKLKLQSMGSKKHSSHRARRAKASKKKVDSVMAE